MARARSTTAASSEDHWRSQLWCGWRPLATRSDTVRPSGATGACGSSPSFFATSLVLSLAMSSPSSTTDPLVGFNRRDSVRRRVDFPQPLGPMMVVITPGGIATSRSSMTVRAPYPTLTPFAVSREASATPDSISVMY